MSETPKVSVVMPVYQVEEYLEECLNSVLSQTLEEIEVICVNDGSTDRSPQILEEYVCRDPRVKVIHKENSGYGHTMNVGIRAARGEYIGIVETDDYILPTMYERLYAYASRYALDVVRADWCEFTREENGVQKNEIWAVTKKEHLYGRVLDPKQDTHIFKSGTQDQSGIYRREFLKEHNIVHNETPGASYQDNGFLFQLLCFAERMAFYPEAFYMLRRDNPNASIRSEKKVYCLCEEYDFAHQKLEKDETLRTLFGPWCAYRRYRMYLWNLKRIAPEFRLDFLYRFQSDFRKIEADGELDPSVFNTKQWNLLKEIMDDPGEMYERKVKGRVLTDSDDFFS